MAARLGSGVMWGGVPGVIFWILGLLLRQVLSASLVSIPLRLTARSHFNLTNRFIMAF